MPKYKALTPIRHGEERGKIKEISVDEIVTLTEEAAAPLLESGAIEPQKEEEKGKPQ